MVKIGHETIFYILSKNSNDKKGFRFEASLITLPDTWKHCLSPKRFYQISLKICKAVFVAGFYQGLRGVLSPWLLSTVNSHESKILESISILLIVKMVKRLAPWFKGFSPIMWRWTKVFIDNCPYQFKVNNDVILISVMRLQWVSRGCWRSMNDLQCEFLFAFPAPRCLLALTKTEWNDKAEHDHWDIKW